MPPTRRRNDADLTEFIQSVNDLAQTTGAFESQIGKLENEMTTMQKIVIGPKGLESRVAVVEDWRDGVDEDLKDLKRGEKTAGKKDDSNWVKWIPVALGVIAIIMALVALSDKLAGLIPGGTP